jgi:hypothetical protein
MSEKLTADELTALVQRVFQPRDRDRRLAIIVDLPDGETPDNEAWRERREMAADWAGALAPRAGDIGLDEVRLVLYRNARANNADLPATGWIHPPPADDGSGSGLPPTADEVRAGDTMPFDRIFETFDILIAPTEFSATAPLKIAAPEFGFRAATMPGFAKSMIPALRLDYGLIGARVDRFKTMLDHAERCEITFDASGARHELVLDLRHRQAHASGGVFPVGGEAGNLPSGESYIVPYEGEVEGDPTRSAGEIPVQLEGEIVVYRVEGNRAVEVLSDNPTSRAEAERLAAEPAYGNMAELGLGVLGDFGLEPTGEILLDEKLGLHIAFGRSEHFGGQVGPGAFTSPDKVVHIDRIYIPKLQPDVAVAAAVLKMDDGAEIELMKDGKYVVSFD